MISVCLFIASLLFDCCSFYFLLFDSLFDYSVFDYFVYLSVLILELYSRHFNPLNNNHPVLNKHHTTDSIIFVLVWEQEPITIIDIEGCLEQISPYGLSRRQDNKKIH